ncbi:hypothetical protein D3C76_881030 [compost metagenome]
MLLDPLIGKRQSRQLPLAPRLPMLQIVAGFDAEPLEAITLTGPVENQLLQRRLDGAGVQKPATQSFFAHLQLSGGLHLDQSAIGARLHLNARSMPGGVRRVVQREPFDVGQHGIVVSLRGCP